MEPRERSARRRHRAKRRGTPLRGWRHKAGGLLQRRHESGMVFEAAVRGRRKIWPSDRSHSRKPAGRGNCVTSHRLATVCATAKLSTRSLHHRRPSPRRLAAARRLGDRPATPCGEDLASGRRPSRYQDRWSRPHRATPRPDCRRPCPPRRRPHRQGRSVMAASGIDQAGRLPSRPDSCRTVAVHRKSALEMASVSCHIFLRQMTYRGDANGDRGRNHSS